MFILYDLPKCVSIYLNNSLDEDMSNLGHRDDLEEPAYIPMKS